MAWSLRPPWWGLLLTLLAFAAFLRLGVWQVHRGQDKQALQQQYAAAATQAPVELDSGSVPPPGLRAVPAHAHGSYLPERQLLLDLQSHEDLPGYDVWTPLRLPGGGLLIVNRGWVPYGADRRSLPPLPAPAGEVDLHGWWRALPEPGLRLGGPQCVAGQPPADWPRVATFPTVADLSCFYGMPVAAGELLLAEDAAGGFARDWKSAAVGFSPQRHFAYAAQWFAFALAAIVVFLVLNLKRTP